MNSIGLKIRVLASVYAGLLSYSAEAYVLEGQANQRQILPGGRAAMMAGAYTALSRDASGSYYNPAGLGFAPDNGVNISTTLFRESRLTFKNTINNKPFDQRSATIVPGFIGGIKAFKPITLGYSFMTIDASNVYQQNSFENISTVEDSPNTFSRTHQEASSYLLAGASWAWQLSPRFSIGHSLFYYQRQTKASTYQIATFNGGGTSSAFDTFNTLNTGVTHVGGLMFDLGSFSIGASVKKSFAMSNNTDRIVEQTIDDPATDDETYVLRYDLKHNAMNELNPTTYRLGVAYRIPTILTISADYLLHEAVRSPYADQYGAHLYETSNYSLGAELNLGPLSLRGGVFSNNSMHKKPIEGGTNQPLYVNYMGQSFGFGWDIGSLQGHVGVINQDGRGKAQVVTDSQAIQNVEAFNRLYVITGKIPIQ